MRLELKDLTEYHVTPETVDDIGTDAAYFLRRRSGKRVGVIGLSFAGGLALIAASRPEYADHMGFVLAVGSHDSMSRVAKFFASNLLVRPDGTQEHFQAHEYGVLILGLLTSGRFLCNLRMFRVHMKILRRHLWEQPSPPDTGLTSAQGQAEMDLLVNHHERLETGNAAGDRSPQHRRWTRFRRAAKCLVCMFRFTCCTEQVTA